MKLIGSWSAGRLSQTLGVKCSKVPECIVPVSRVIVGGGGVVAYAPVIGVLY